MHEDATDTLVIHFDDDQKQKKIIETNNCAPAILSTLTNDSKMCIGDKERGYTLFR